MTNESGKKLRWLAVSVLVLAGIIGALWYWGLPIYHSAKESRSVREAQAYMEKHDYRNAVMCARLALMMNPTNLAACRIMADLAEMSGSPTALDWRQKIAEANPSADNRLALASAALQYQSPPFQLTTEVLGSLKGTETNSVSYHTVAAMLALRLNQPGLATDHLKEAQRLQPTNRNLTLNLAVLDLNTTNPATAEAARSTLVGFIDDTNFAVPALRSLISERIIHKDHAGAKDFSTRLMNTGHAELNDQLQHLSLLKLVGDPRLKAELNTLQQSSTTNAVIAARIAAWMESNGFLDEAGPWLNSLPEEIRAQPITQVALADYYVGTSNWGELSRLTAKGDWDEANFLRKAYLARALDALGQSLVADSQWHNAIDMAEDHAGAVNALLNFGARWKKANAAEEILSNVVFKYPSAVWAQQMLEQYYFSLGQTRSLYEMYCRLLAQQPDSIILKNNAAATGLLLRTNLPQSTAWAEEIYRQNPTQPVFATTYAYAQLLNGRGKEGLAALQSLPESQLQQPSVALYFGLLLRSQGQSAQADKFLSIAENAGGLLPEESELIRKQ